MRFPSVATSKAAAKADKLRRSHIHALASDNVVEVSARKNHEGGSLRKCAGTNTVQIPERQHRSSRDLEAAETLLVYDAALRAFADGRERQSCKTQGSGALP